MSYVIKETCISAVINVIFTVVFFFALFHDQPQLILGGSSKLTLDFLPQAFFIGFFSALPPSLITLRRMKKGVLALRAARVLPLPASLPIRIVLFALASLLIFGGGAVLLVFQIDAMSISFSTALLLKAVYAIFITAVITPLAVNAVLANT